MRSETPKVLHDICGKPMIAYSVDLVKSLGVKKAVFITGYGSEMVGKHLEGFKAIKQSQLLGTADAVNRARDYFKDFTGDILVIYGDAPLLRGETIEGLISKYKESENDCAILTTILKNPTGYGRIVRDANDRVTKIVEDQSATVFEKTIEEINVGAYCFNAKKLFPFIDKIQKDKKKKEYYLTDIIKLFSQNKLKIASYTTEDPTEMVGVNSREDLAYANRVIRDRINSRFMRQGVTIVDPRATYISGGASIGEDTTIYPGTVIESNVKIGKKCSIGPYAHLRGDIVLDDNVAVGNFAEIKRAHIGSGTKVRHHCYLGDVSIGKNVNIGAGAITANYDGKKKNKTTIEDGAFIGCNAVLVAPVKIGKNAVVGAGCVVPRNKNVPKNAVAVGVPARLHRK